MGKAAAEFRQYMGDLSPGERSIIALDDMTKTQSARLLGKLSGMAGVAWLAKENSNAQRKGWDDAASRTRRQRFELMADAKYHDTPRTMRDEVKAATLSGARFITVHASAGVEALRAAVSGRDAAREELASRGDTRLELPGALLGITVLTSLNDGDCKRIYNRTVRDQVRVFEGIAEEADLEGLVCSGQDLEILESNLVRVNPGIVLPGTEAYSGQERTSTPSEAIQAGADYLVFGSTVTKAADQVQALQLGVEDLARGLRAIDQ